MTDYKITTHRIAGDETVPTSADDHLQGLVSEGWEPISVTPYIAKGSGVPMALMLLRKG